ncbi:MAG: hypothetical protein FJ145_15020 [Deltaproteobacteria bacterium]|nr:hypothetical protein [Deltaproteobacteria bacterium]
MINFAARPITAWLRTALVLLVVSSCDRGTTLGSELPAEVKQFQESRDLCDHFRGEEGYDAERREFLLKQMKTHCTGTDEKLRALRRKYQSNQAVLEQLKKYEDKIE